MNLEPEEETTRQNQKEKETEAVEKTKFMLEQWVQNSSDMELPLGLLSLQIVAQIF
jgi:hypothetical protein